MKIKLSDYILEQSISEADTTDILLEQAMSELEVCTSLAYAYLKQLTMEEYMNPDGELTAEDVVTEASAEATATTDGGGGVGAAVSSIGKGFAGFFKAVIGAITGFFRWVGNKIGQIGDKVAKNGKQLAQKVEAATEEELQTVVQKLAATKKRDIAAIYYSYNPSNVKTFYDTLDTSSQVSQFLENCVMRIVRRVSQSSMNIPVRSRNSQIPSRERIQLIKRLRISKHLPRASRLWLLHTSSTILPLSVLQDSVLLGKQLVLSQRNSQTLIPIGEFIRVKTLVMESTML